MRVRQAGAASSQRELELELHRLVLRVRLYETHLPYTEPNTSREATARTGRGGRGGPGRPAAAAGPQGAAKLTNTLTAKTLGCYAGPKKNSINTYK